VGTRFRGGPQQWNLKLPGKLIHLDIDARNIDLTHRADLALVGDAKLGLAALASGLNAPAGDPAFVARMQAARDDVRAAHRKRIGEDHAAIMDAMRAGMPDDAIFVRDMTIPAYAWGNQHFPILRPRTTMNPVSGAIGPGLPMAIGAAIGTGRKTVLLQGDGGFTMHIGELATAVQYRLPLVVCVFTDGGYGVLRLIQRNNFEGRNVGVELATPDFVQVAHGMGLAAEKVTGAAAFAPAFARAMAAEGPYLLDIDASSLQSPTGWGVPRQVTSPGG
jgi:acetolactate synthase-1/2/3 large subunit